MKGHFENSGGRQWEPEGRSSVKVREENGPQWQHGKDGVGEISA